MNDAGVVAGWYQVGGNPVGVGFYNDGTCHTISGMSYPFAITGNYVVGQDYASVDASSTRSAMRQPRTSAGLPAMRAGSAVLRRQRYWHDGRRHELERQHKLRLSVQRWHDAHPQYAVTGTDPFSSLQYATAISANGTYIVGYGTVGSQTHGFLLTAAATPEPSALLLVATGLAGLLAYAWRRRK